MIEKIEFASGCILDCHVFGECSGGGSHHEYTIALDLSHFDALTRVKVSYDGASREMVLRTSRVVTPDDGGAKMLAFLEPLKPPAVPPPSKVPPMATDEVVIPMPEKSSSVVTENAPFAFQQGGNILVIFEDTRTARMIIDDIDGTLVTASIMIFEPNNRTATLISSSGQEIPVRIEKILGSGEVDKPRLDLKLNEVTLQTEASNASPQTRTDADGEGDEEPIMIDEDVASDPGDEPRPVTAQTVPPHPPKVMISDGALPFAPALNPPATPVSPPPPVRPPALRPEFEEPAPPSDSNPSSRRAAIIGSLVGIALVILVFLFAYRGGIGTRFVETEQSGEEQEVVAVAKGIERSLPEIEWLGKGRYTVTPARLNFVTAASDGIRKWGTPECWYLITKKIPGLQGKPSVSCKGQYTPENRDAEGNVCIDVRKCTIVVQ